MLWVGPTRRTEFPSLAPQCSPAVRLTVERLSDVKAWKCSGHLECLRKTVENSPADTRTFPSAVQRSVFEPLQYRSFPRQSGGEVELISNGEHNTGPRTFGEQEV